MQRHAAPDRARCQLACPAAGGASRIGWPSTAGAAAHGGRVEKWKDRNLKAGSMQPTLLPPPQRRQSEPPPAPARVCRGAQGALTSAPRSPPGAHLSPAPRPATGALARFWRPAPRAPGAPANPGSGRSGRSDIPAGLGSTTSIRRRRERTAAAQRQQVRAGAARAFRSVAAAASQFPSAPSAHRLRWRRKLNPGAHATCA